jgi:hypothetical protein
MPTIGLVPKHISLLRSVAAIHSGLLNSRQPKGTNPASLFADPLEKEARNARKIPSAR